MINKIRKLLGLCIHKWKYVRTEHGDFNITEVMKCSECNKRKGVTVG